MTKHHPRSERISVIVLLLALCVFLGLGAYQLRLPGLHYDEAKEAGLNAMELITGRPVTAFRAATVPLGPWRLPLMVQDYIGALNVLLALPFLAIGGVNVVALRWLPLLIGALTLLVTWRVAWRLGGPVAAAATACLLAVSPTFIFWSRQGIFVTNLVALIFMASLLTGLRWWEKRRPRDLWLTTFLWGLGVYAKLLFVWAIAALIAVAVVAWLLEARKRSREAANHRQAEKSSWRSRASTLTLALIFFLLPLIPLIIFNLRTGGTLESVFGNLGRSYYGVNNSAYLPNLGKRLHQLVALLRGDHLGYLGGPFADAGAPWLLLGLILLGGLALGLNAITSGRQSEDNTDDNRPHAASGPEQGAAAGASELAFLAPVLILALVVAQSAFTVSDLFITHYALIVPLLALAGGLAFGVTVAQWRAARRAGSRAGTVARILQILAIVALLAWIAGGLLTAIRYHRALAATGGHGAQSDAIYAVAEHLDSAGFTAPVALDWGLDAPIRFLTAGRVQPIEVFGYTDLNAPDSGFAERINQLLDDPNNLYLAHLPEQTVFRERVNTLADLAAKRGMTLRQRALYTERDGTPIIIMYRADK